MKSGKAEKVIHFFLMLVPNILNPNKLAANLRHPVHEMLHTSHKQYFDEDSRFYVVEHYLFGRVVTVDAITESFSPAGFWNRVTHLFRKDFYYGHAEYFPKRFRLIKRWHVKNGELDIALNLRLVK